MRLPQTAIEHQRALWGLLWSIRNSRHSGLAHGRSRPGLDFASASQANTARAAADRPGGTSSRHSTPPSPKDAR
jgi:hypothetical protein